MNKKKTRHIGKRKACSSARKRLRKIHTSEYENSCLTKKKKIVLYFKEDTIDSKKLQSAVPSLTSRERIVQAAPSKIKNKKKKSQGREREREREEDRVRTGGKRRRKKRKGKKGRKKRKKWREWY